MHYSRSIFILTVLLLASCKPKREAAAYNALSVLVSGSDIIELSSATGGGSQKVYLTKKDKKQLLRSLKEIDLTPKVINSRPSQVERRILFLVGKAPKGEIHISDSDKKYILFNDSDIYLSEYAVRIFLEKFPKP